MTIQEKRNLTLKRVSGIIEPLMGFSPDEITADMVFSKDLNMDDPTAIRFMMNLDVAFQCDFDDTYFLPDKTTPSEKLWKNRTVGELVDFIIETINFKDMR
jgi:acyl carrier protein